MHTRFQDLDLSNAFLFAAALEDPDTCRLILETLLSVPVSKVNVHTEHSMLFSSDFRSIRLDVYANNEDLAEYNLEMQNENEGNLAKRSRFHQGEMDVMSLLPGQDFEELPPVYVIFICTFDPFGEGFYRYTFKNMCQEKSFPLNDGAVRIFLNTKGCNESEVPEVLVNFLHYVENSTDTYVESLKDQTVSRIHERITQVKKSRRWERRYMKFEELLRNSAKKGWEDGHKKGEEAGRKAGLEAGRKTGQEQILELTSRMAAAGESNLIPKLRTDPDLLQKMLEKYELL